MDSDTTLSRLQYYVLFIDGEGLANSGYYVYGTSIINMLNSKTTNTFTYDIYTFSATDVIIGLSGM